MLYQLHSSPNRKFYERDSLNSTKSAHAYGTILAQQSSTDINSKAGVL